jgi:hypothetical protein
MDRVVFVNYDFFYSRQGLTIRNEWLRAGRRLKGCLEDVFAAARKKVPCRSSRAPNYSKTHQIFIISRSNAQLPGVQNEEQLWFVLNVDSVVGDGGASDWNRSTVE